MAFVPTSGYLVLPTLFLLYLLVLENILIFLRLVKLKLPNYVLSRAVTAVFSAGGVVLNIIIIDNVLVLTRVVDASYFVTHDQASALATLGGIRSVVGYHERVAAQLLLIRYERRRAGGLQAVHVRWLPRTLFRYFLL